MTRRSATLLSGLAVALGVVCLGYSYFVEPHRLVINELNIPVKSLDPRLNGLRIAAISDIHAGSNGADRENLRRVVDEVNLQNADLIVMLGDYFSPGTGPGGLAMPADELAANLSGLRARYGVYVVLGNHDYGRRGVDVTSAFTRQGYKVLDGELTVLDIDGARLRLLGLRDHMHIGTWKGYSENAKALLASTEGHGDVIVLQHSPDVLPIITGGLSISNDLRLMISGHTHGGQVNLPVLGPPLIPSSYGQKYARGHIKDAGLDLFVTTGIGTSILPFRFMVPPEIAVLTIRSE